MANKEEYAIQKGVPIPKGVGRGKRGKYRFGEMAVGDSIVIPKVDRNSATSTWSRFKPKVFTSAINEKDPTQVRIWRIK
jgi:hypothetical protein